MLGGSDARKGVVAANTPSTGTSMPVARFEWRQVLQGGGSSFPEAAVPRLEALGFMAVTALPARRARMCQN